ncbi:MAG: hypothetical protein GDA36_08380 [Rhodobacteraceae bacterium]|nr:hypothetical protein [Paracoccaceae bacterium]
MPGDKMKFNGFARLDGESFSDKVHKGHLRIGPGAPEFDTMVEGSKVQAGMADKACASKTTAWSPP